jgi:hypothetical protein
VLSAYRAVEGAGVAAVVFDELRIAVGRLLGMGGDVLFPQPLQGDALAPQFTVDSSTRSPCVWRTLAAGSSAAARATSPSTARADHSRPVSLAAVTYLLTTPLDNCKARAIFS